MKAEELSKQIENSINESLKGCPQYILEFGVFAGTEKDGRIKERNKQGKVVNKKDAEKGLTNAEILYIMEHGSPLRHVPARPILAKTKEYAINHLIPKAEEEIINIWLFEGKNGEKKIQQIVDALALKIEAYVKTGIRRRKFDLIPNALSTIEKKKSDLPLFDTGQLVNSIQCRAVRIY